VPPATGRSRRTAPNAPYALFVDDEANILDGISMALHGRNFRILTAGSPNEALELLAREPVGVVVSDEQMPAMSGTDFLTEVRRRHPEIVRMVLSGTLDPRTISRAVNEAGVFRYLLKPCTPGDLGLAVEQALEAHAVRRSGTAPRHLDVNIDQALARLHMAMQPIYASRDGQLFAHEALVRLPAEMGAGAGDLLDAADADGRLWEVERAIRRSVATRLDGRPAETCVFVNLHPRSLLDPQLYTTTDPLAPFADAVVLEITERGSLEEVDDLRHRVESLRDLGYRIAIDDMGSGYSGLTAFTAILPDFVKFDRELIRAMHSTPSKNKLVRSIAAVCRELTITTVAEGVEDENDLRAAREMGCNLLQGYLLGYPEDAFTNGPSTLGHRTAAAGEDLTTRPR
jgi:EAL domain-containing protein (putative c-di-GMP-specific phosphodiesterase class I)